MKTTQPPRDHAYEWDQREKVYRALCMYTPTYERANEFRPRGRPCLHCVKKLDRRVAWMKERADRFRVHGHEFQEKGETGLTGPAEVSGGDA